MPPIKLSIIIPTLNEAAIIDQALANVADIEGAIEIIMVDGGSSDATVALAARAGVTLLHAPRGRASQMNQGAEAAQGDVLLFLHADTRLPANAYAAIMAVLAQPNIGGGSFRLRFDHDHKVLRGFSFFSRFNLPFCHYGDSAYFVRKSVFDTLGGYRRLPIMEDIDFFMRLYRSYRTAVVQTPVITSARRFLRAGVFRLQAAGVILVILFLCKVRPAWIKTIYDYIQPRETRDAQPRLQTPDPRRKAPLSAAGLMVLALFKPAHGQGDL